MTYILQRKCREIGQHGLSQPSECPPRPIEAWKDKAAYVLLGPPGAGKSTTFRHEAKCQGGCYVTARDFMTFDDRPEWHDKTLFVDGLDETRAGNVDGRTKLDTIRAKLHRMGCPRFRLSCRDADWFGANDRDHVETVSPDGTITILRLEPLCPRDVGHILAEVSGIGDTDSFIDSARQRGLDGLLTNPQSLRMLAKAVEVDGGWPKTRTEAFERACHTLLQESNDEHRLAKPDRDGIFKLMNASGKLCAVQLLTGAEGYTLSGNDGKDQFLELDLTGQDPAILRQCLRSRLFQTPMQCRAVPVHRQTAEFLAARYLAELISKGLPVGRILALITGYDSVVIPELRGLSAWFAAQSKSSRSEIMELDPLGTVLYGDTGGFSASEKRVLLDGIHREAGTNPRLVLTHQLGPRLGELVSSDMERYFLKILSDPSRAHSRQSFMAVLIETLQYGARLPGLAEPLMKLLRDDTWWPGIRLEAIEPFVRHRCDKKAAYADLKALAVDINTGEVPDYDCALLGELLSTLYPETIPETEIMRYLCHSLPTDPSPGYEEFWTRQLPQKSTKNRINMLLDSLDEACSSLFQQDRKTPISRFFRRLPSILVARLLKLSGDKVNPTRLFHWLGLAANASGRPYGQYLDRKESRKIRDWLESHPDTWKTLLAMGIKERIYQVGCDGTGEINSHVSAEMCGRLFGSNQPSDFGLWCLGQAICTEDMEATQWFLGETAKCLHYDRLNKDLSRKAVSRRLADYPELEDAFNSKMSELEAHTSRVSALENRCQSSLSAESPNWHADVKPYEDKLRENTASTVLLCELAKVYFGGYVNVPGDSGRERLNSLLAGDASLVEAVLSGFRGTIGRDDLPSERQVIRLGSTRQTHPLALPLMAGLEEARHTEPPGKLDLKERICRLALAVHYTVPMWSTARDPADSPPQWFDWVLSNHPEIVAEVLIQSVHFKLRSGAETFDGLHDLIHPEYRHVARITAIPILKRFPLRCKSGQLPILDRILQAAMRHCDIKTLLEVIDEKHARPGMNVAQRAHWLTAGLCLAPEAYCDRLKAYATVSERRIRFLAAAVARQTDLSPQPKYPLGVPALRLFIQIIGASCRPFSFGNIPSGGWVTPAMEAADRVRWFIGQLAANATEEASCALDVLMDDNDLHPWRLHLKDAVHQQRARRREAEFRYCSAAQVLETLNFGAPANAADLAALTLDHLHQIARSIRDGNASDWRQYWNVDGHNRPQCPRPENACRDALISVLRSALQPLGIDVQPESHYADDKRADIRVSYANHNVPIEVKRSCAQDLWCALHSQLKTRYIRDPGTAGHGIYLVFWFGNTKGCQPTPPKSGVRPASSRELKDLLEESLSAGERRKIEICVIDVAVPDTSIASSL